VGQETSNVEVLKSSFMLTEVMFVFSSPLISEMVLKSCVQRLYILVEQLMSQLNVDILALNNMLKEDQLLLTRDNPHVVSIMQKIDIISSFIRMIFRVFEKLFTGKENYATYYKFL
jgi:hypothetical protein